METAVGPVANARHEPVLHRIEMNIVDVPRQICLVADSMLPVASLPNSLFTLCDFALRAHSIGQSSRKTAFDEIPATGEIGIAGWQRPNRVQVIGQDANRNRVERAPLLHLSVGAAQTIDFAQQKIARTIGKRQREEECAACYFGASVIRHTPL